MESLDLDDLVLIGHSMGGRNALFYAVGIPEKVSCLVLIDSRPEIVLRFLTQPMCQFKRILMLFISWCLIS